MQRTLILDTFYNDVIKEATHGRVDCFFMLNICFNLTINKQPITSVEELEYKDVIIPTLSINNKPLFDSLLVDYVNKVIEFYDEKEFDFLNDVEYLLSECDSTKQKQVYLIKFIICTLFANASYTDFEDPIRFLERRIEMLGNKILNTEEQINLGYFENIGARLFIKEEQSPIRSETPYRIKGHLEYDDGYKLLLPEIYVGKTDKSYIIYGIQKTSTKSDANEFTYIKKIRKGLNSRLYGMPEHYFLTYIISLILCNDKPIEIVPFLVERWNAKSIALSFNKDLTEEEKNKYKEALQQNITNAFLRTYLKLREVTPEIELNAIPFTIDDRMHLSMLEQPHSKASLMNELYANYIEQTKAISTITKK